MIRVEALRKAYANEPDRDVLRGLSFEIEAGEMVAIVGTSGSGKSTLMHILGGLDSGYRGRVEVDGVELGGMNDKVMSAFRNAKIGFVFQQFNLLDHLTAAENVKLPAYFGSSAGDLDARAAEVLGAVGLGHKLGSRPTQLSGGEKQRVAIARALFNRPRLLLCDEPTGSLDSRTGDRVLELFAELNRAQGITLVVVTHDVAVSERAPRVIRLEDGEIAEDRRRPAGEG